MERWNVERGLNRDLVREKFFVFFFGGAFCLVSGAAGSSYFSELEISNILRKTRGEPGGKDEILVRTKEKMKSERVRPGR